MGLFSRKGESGFSSSSTAEEVAKGIDGSALTAIVTGASAGIGVETARVFASCGVHVIMAVRNVETGQKVKETILKKLPNAKLDVMHLDLASFASVRKFAAEYISTGFPLNLLIHNAGLMAPPFTLTGDNIEVQFETNFLGPFLLTNLLLDTMKKTARESGIEGRIINVSSMAHRYVYKEGIRFDKINEKNGYVAFKHYGQSKLASILHANELARRLKEEGVNITANSLHPGAINTNLLRHHSTFESLVSWGLKYFIKDIPQGAATTCYVALHPAVKGVSGKYFSDSNLYDTSSLAKDEKLAQKVWDFASDLTQSK